MAQTEKCRRLSSSITSRYYKDRFLKNSTISLNNCMEFKNEHTSL
ncbi:unnamed protein product [Moneuplotes crassus]|uniref:Uncharacterized protein n=1 Tax=Euplotes crassus TaxID=5936 RepID=A0AAD1UFU5_EUPCR|nr:unnamed protein product [Moneuplotes crassus]